MNKIKSEEDCLNFLGITKENWGHYKTGPILLKLIEDYDIKSFIEVGSQTGYLSELIAKTHPNVMVYAVDLCHHRPNLHKEYGNLSQICSDSQEAAAGFGDASIDLVYIDALHTYEAVKGDLAAWHPRCKKIFAGHDYGHLNFKGCTKAIDEFFSENPELSLNLEGYYNWWTAL